MITLVLKMVLDNSYLFLLDGIVHFTLKFEKLQREENALLIFGRLYFWNSAIGWTVNRAICMQCCFD